MNTLRAMMLSVGCLALAGCFPERTVTGTRVVTLQYEDAHAIVGGDGKILLVDSGLERNVPSLEKGLVESGLDPTKVVAVVLTHGHAGGPERSSSAARRSSQALPMNRESSSHRDPC